MTLTKTLTASILAVAFAAAPLTTLAAEAKGKESKGLKPYPLETCVVSGEKLGGMGEAFVFAHQGQEIQLCCKDCKKKFDQDPTKFMAQITEANNKVKASKLDTCVVSGEKLGADAPSIVFKGQEVKFCCKDCVKEFKKNSDKYVAKLK